MITRYYTSVRSSWEAMLALCENAQESIELEEYILHPDTIGSRFINVFVRKASEGVKVHLVLDWWGCTELVRSKALKRMRDAGVKVSFYRPPALQWLLRDPRFFPRDHRKVLIIDQKEAFVGGVCIYDKITEWRDTMVLVEGKVVEQLSHVFWQMWAKMNDDHDEREVTAHPNFENAEEYSVYVNAPDSYEHNFSDWLIESIKNAKSHVRLVTPYFTPSERLLPALHDALNRGIKVDIILSAYSKKAPYWAGKHESGDLIRRGAHIYYYQPHMIHLKMMIVDNALAAIGSCNLDGLSMYRNQEVMLVTKNSVAIATLNEHFDEDLANSSPLSLDEWKRRNLKEKAMGLMLRPMRKYL